jgi:outer membrane protein
MRRQWDRGQPRQETRWSFWLKGTMVWLGVMVWSVQSLPGQTTSTQPPAPPLEGTQTAPPAMPLSATERVLELSLRDAIQMALQHNLDIERQRFGPQIARTEVEKARAAFDPITGLDASLGSRKVLPEQIIGVGGALLTQSLTIALYEIAPYLQQKIVTGAGYEIRFLHTREDISGNLRAVIPDPRYESSIELIFRQPLLRDFGIAVNTAQIRQTQYAEQSAEQVVLQTILDTVFDVQQRYWELTFRLQDLDAKRESQKLAEDFLAENKVRVELGTLAPIELVQAETQVKTRQGDVIVAVAAVREAEDLLKEVLNIPETLGTWFIRIRPIDSPPFVPVSPISLEEQIDLALKNRPDFVQSQLDIASREISREVARNQRLPRLDLEAQGSILALGERGTEGFSNLVDTEGHEWLVTLRFQYPLGNRFARHELQKRNLELQQALVDQRQLKRTIVRQLRQAIRDIDTTLQRVEVTRAATVLAQTQLEAEQEKFRLGLSTSFVVLDFQEDLTIARSEETRAVSDYNIALAQLDQITGTLHYGVAAPPKNR